MLGDSYRQSYINGNYSVYFTNLHYRHVKIKRALRLGEDLVSSFPDSIDLKITNKCSTGCPFCHESSSPDGKSFDLARTLDVLGQLPHFGIEVAIGGGNILEIWPETEELIKGCNKYNFNPRVTVNYQDLLMFVKKHSLDEFNGRLTFGVGISMAQAGYIENPLVEELENLGKSLNLVVFHVIVGINSPEDVRQMIRSDKYERVLILGFKQFGRASNQEPARLEEWKSMIKQEIYRNRTLYTGPDKTTIGFDNLALEQLDIESSLTTSEFDRLYFGDEFSSTMYVDAVSETFAPTSRSPLNERVSWKDTDILSYFRENKRPFKE